MEFWVKVHYYQMLLVQLKLMNTPLQKHSRLLYIQQAYQLSLVMAKLSELQRVFEHVTYIPYSYATGPSYRCYFLYKFVKPFIKTAS